MSGIKFDAKSLMNGGNMAVVKPEIAALDKRRLGLKNQRTNWETHWQQLADYMLPRRADITKKRPRATSETNI